MPFSVTPPAAAEPVARARVPTRFWIYAAFAVCYGICETMNGNWASIDVRQLGGSATMASAALTAFWASVTVGRIGFAALQRWVPAGIVFRVLPFVLALTFLAISQLPEERPVLAIAVFAVAGLGCSALLPLTISFGQEELVEMGVAVAGSLIACYQLGYGIAAFGAGPIEDAGVDLSTLFGWTAGVAALMGVLSFLVTRAPRPGALDAGPRQARGT